MARPGSRRHAALAALQLVCVASRAVVAAPDAVRASPSTLVAVNWASSAAYGATASANSAGHWVRGAVRERCSWAAPRAARYILWAAGLTRRRATRLSRNTRWMATIRPIGPVPAARCALQLTLGFGTQSNCPHGALYIQPTPCHHLKTRLRAGLLHREQPGVAAGVAGRRAAAGNAAVPARPGYVVHTVAGQRERRPVRRGGAPGMRNLRDESKLAARNAVWNQGISLGNVSPRSRSCGGFCAAGDHVELRRRRWRMR